MPTFSYMTVSDTLVIDWLQPQWLVDQQKSKRWNPSWCKCTFKLSTQKLIIHHFWAQKRTLSISAPTHEKKISGRCLGVTDPPPNHDVTHCDLTHLQRSRGGARSSGSRLLFKKNLPSHAYTDKLRREVRSETAERQREELRERSKKRNEWNRTSQRKERGWETETKRVT